jgi:2-oxoglutarate ferredoxin oxidoreductase subunit beta
MVHVDDYGTFETAWCPGCGNFSILQTLKKALTEKDLAPHQVLFVSGIGQAAKAPHYFRCNLFNGLHGRSLPVATGARLANPDLQVVVESGDGCNYGEGGNHFLAALRRNVNVVMLVHDNQIYGLTKGQASPTTEEGHVTKAQPQGTPTRPFAPLSVALAMQAGFVARAFCGMQDHMKGLIQAALDHPGFALVDILQNCVSFNHVNTFSWYKQRCYPLEGSYDPSDWEAAIKRAQEWGDSIPVGLFYQNTDRPPFESRFPFLEQGPLFDRERDAQALREVMGTFA